MTRKGPWLVGSLLLGLTLAGCLGDDAPELDVDDQIQNVPVVPGSYNFSKNYSQVLVAGAYRALPLQFVTLASGLDGAEIQMSIWRPDVPTDVKTPVIVQASPYWPADLQSEAAARAIERYRENFVEHGYTVVALPVRGTSNHGGCMDLMGPKERADLDQAITWLGTQEWSNGKVGMIGVSYDGSTPFEVAAMGNKHLATIVPISGVPDIYGLMFRNGTAEVRGPLVLNALYYSYWNTEGRDPEKMVAGAVCPESFEGFEASLWSGATGDEDPNGWWLARNSKPGVEANYKGSILFVQGLQDWNVDPALAIPWIESLDEEGITVHQWLGQWPHAAPDSRCREATPYHAACRWDWATYLHRWFDHWLKGDTTVNLGPAVQIERQDGEWRTEAHWPPWDAAAETYWLAPSGRLASDSSGSAGSVRLLPNPAGLGTVAGLASAPGAYADFTTGPLAEARHIAGLPTVHVTVVPEGPGGTLAAWLYSRGADGVLHRIGWTAMNLAFGDGSTTMKPVVPGQPLVARMQIQPMDAVVPAGHEIVLRVWQVPPEDRVANAPPSPIVLQYGGGRSIVQLPFIERHGETDFDPPFPAAATS